MKKIAAMLVCILSAGMLGGCGSSFDASAYLKAVLDNSYKDDSTGFVEMKVGTAEQSETLYQEGLQETVDAYLVGINVTDEQREAFEETFADILAGAKYTVGEAEKQDDGSYVVTVTYEQMNIHVPSMALYEEKTDELLTEWQAAVDAGEEIPSDDEMIEQYIDLLNVCLQETYADITYNEPAATTVKIEVIDNLWTPDTADLLKLSTLMFDAQEASAQQ